MEKRNISLEARKAFYDFKVEMAEELKTSHEHIYDLRNNLSTLNPRQPNLIKTEKKSRKNPNFSFSDFLGKGF